VPSLKDDDDAPQTDHFEMWWPSGLSLLVGVLSFFFFDKYAPEIDSFKQLASSSTVIGTVCFGFLSATLAIFLSNDKNDVLVAFRKSKHHRRRMLWFFKEAMVAAFLLVGVSITLAAFGKVLLEWWPVCATPWVFAITWVLATVGRVYSFIFGFFD
jgi:hypothetical protein